MQLRTKTQTSISRKICCVNSGFEILYAVEQFSSPFSKDKLKQGTHTHQTQDPPSRMSWENCRGVSTNISHMCSVELALKGLALTGKGLLHTGFPKTRSAQFYPFGAIFPSLCIAATFEVCVSLWTPAPVCSWFWSTSLAWQSNQLGHAWQVVFTSYPFCYPFIGA